MQSRNAKREAYKRILRQSGKVKLYGLIWKHPNSSVQQESLFWAVDARHARRLLREKVRAWYDVAPTVMACSAVEPVGWPVKESGTFVASALK
jgi:hypothetical protein